MAFKDIALPMAARGVPCTPVRPNTKKAFLPNFPETATTDPAQIVAWDAAYPNHNGACVARANLNGFWFFEVDGPGVLERIRKETGHDLLNEVVTFRVRSRPGRGHFYFKQSPASLAMGNLNQAYIKEADWSARVDNMYVVAAGSLHPNSDQPYAALSDAPIAQAPDWLIEWLLSQKITTKTENAADAIRNDRGLVPHGSIHGYMLKEAGKLRNLGLDADEIYPALSALVHKNCEPPIDESKVQTMAKSICNFPEGQNRDLVLSQPTQIAQTFTQAAQVLEEPEAIPHSEYPKFPNWVMEGTSLYEEFVKPFCAPNDRIPYFMWIPAMQILLNYVGPKVQIKNKDFRGSTYVVLIGAAGKAHKSASCRDAMKYFEYANILQHFNKDIKNAEGKCLTFTVGSPEGLGMVMEQTNCKNAVLYYDELSQLIAKMGIESSTMRDALLLMYEGEKFQNQTKSKKDGYSLNPGTYCASLITCTTTKKFAEQWSHLAGSDTGLDDRFMFVPQPEALPKRKLLTSVNFMNGAAKTRQLIDRAINKQIYEFDSYEHPGMEALNEIGSRFAIRAEKWALGIAIDLGLDSIDDDCVDRAVAIVRYEIDVKKYLKSYEAVTREGEIQQKIRRQLEMSGGRVERRELMRLLNYSQYGTSLWGAAYGGLLKIDDIREEGSGAKGDPKCVRLVRARSIDEEN